ncbi:MAG: hypothetical protein Q7K43_04435, partial [Candidatus Woesearchaeota archaeon]|nr:hypothetical protein [Candidatus Woesearchaeota archaeon]
MKKTVFLLLALAALLFSMYYNYENKQDNNYYNSTSNTTEKKTDQLTANIIENGEIKNIKSSEKSQTETKESKEIIKEFIEGELVFFPKLKATDPDGNKITYQFSKPLNSSGKWQTKEGDAGEYTINITATDGELNATQQIQIRIKKQNHTPILTISKTNIKAKEGETLNIDAKVSDPDNDSVSLTFSGFSTTASKPLSYDDAGKHEVELTADDGKLKTTKKITIDVENVNRAPAFEQLKEVIVTEGGLVFIKPKVSDPDGDEVKLTFSKPLNSLGEWQTKEGDAGEYLINITAKDGSLNSTLQSKVIVETQNKAPKIDVKETTIRVKEGETVVLNFTVTDPEGDKVETEISGWMTSKTKPTDFSSQGTHQVTITAKDATHTTTQLVIIEVENVNRAPVFDD